MPNVEETETEVVNLWVNIKDKRHKKGLVAAREVLRQYTRKVRELATEMKKEEKFKSRKKGAPSAITFILHDDGEIVRQQKPLPFGIKGLWSIQAQMAVDTQRAYDMEVYEDV